MNISQPTLLVDEKKCRKNILKMLKKAESHKLIFRPHFKTHQSLEIGKWFKELGTNKITVSSLKMAEYFSCQWKDITVAFPLNILEMHTVNELAKKITLNVCIENIESIQFLKKRLKHKINFFLKVDIGYHRTGINAINDNLINSILKEAEKNPLINFLGFLGHAGHTYKSRNKKEINKQHNRSLKIMRNLKEKFIKKFPKLIVSVGDTPSCSVAENFLGVDEIRPGNFVFYDLTQNMIGSNNISQVAVAMACPIVALHKDRQEIVIYGGGIHFSKDKMIEKNRDIYGKIVKRKKKGWGDLIPGVYVKSLSQEHGIISCTKSFIEHHKIGDYLMILPVHSCMAVDAMQNLLTLDGKLLSKL